MIRRSNAKKEAVFVLRDGSGFFFCVWPQPLGGGIFVASRNHSPLKLIAMKIGPVIIEVRCRLECESPEWEEIDDLSLEVGYRAKSGKTLWKNIGWLRDRIEPVGKNFAHALWRSKSTDQVLAFDFIPTDDPKSQSTDRTYFIRKVVTAVNGRRRTSKPQMLRGDYEDNFFEVTPTYPSEGE